MNQPAEKSTTIEGPDLIAIPQAYLHLDMAMDHEEVVAMGDLELQTGTEMNIERSPGTVGDLLAAAGVVVVMTCSEVLRTGGDLAMGIGMTSGGHHEATMEMVTEELYHLCHTATGERRRTGFPIT